MSVENAVNMLRKARVGGYAVGAFNITSINQMEGVLETAKDMGSPVIIQTSVTPSKFLKPEVIAAAFHTLARPMKVPACLHLDHCSDPDWCKRCADSGYTNIMIDGSLLDYEENIRLTYHISSYCHSAGNISVEGELGMVKGVEDEIEVDQKSAELCDPKDAVDFVKRTGIDLFAPAIGTAHGVYCTPSPVVEFDRLNKIRKMMDDEELDIPLVIHGGTGLSSAYISRLIKSGGSKYNVSTALKHVLIESSANYLEVNKKEYNPGNLDKHVRNETKKEINRWIKILGSKGKAK